MLCGGGDGRAQARIAEHSGAVHSTSSPEEHRYARCPGDAKDNASNKTPHNATCPNTGPIRGGDIHEAVAMINKTSQMSLVLAITSDQVASKR